MPSRVVNGHALQFAEAGDGPPVVLVHGTLQDQRYWAPQMDALAADFRPIALSLRHYWPERWDGQGTDFTIAQHVEDVAAFLATFGAPVHLLGHSRGGHIAFRVAERFPERIRALVLAEPGGELDATLGGAAPAGRQAAGFAAAAAAVREGRIEDGLRIVAENTGGPGAWEKRPEPRRQIARDNALTLLGQVNEARAPFSRAAAEAIRAPTLLVGGDQTRPQFVANLEAMAAHIAGAERATIPNAAHGMSQDNPAAFNATVLDFLRRH